MNTVDAKNGDEVSVVEVAKEVSVVTKDEEAKDPTMPKGYHRNKNAIIVYKRGQCYIESKYPTVLKQLLKDPTIAGAVIKPSQATVGTNASKKRKYMWHPDGEMEPGDDEDADDDIDVHSFQIKRELAVVVKERAMDLRQPLLEEYDYKSDKENPNIPEFYLKSSTHIRPYQERALSQMLGSGRARSGIIVLPCGAGKTLTAIIAAQTIRKSVLVLAPNTTSVHQWKDQFLLFTNIPKDRISIVTSDLKENIRPDEEACVLITTYQMLAFGGKRASETKEIMELINGRSRGWGLLVLDETHVVPASKYRLAVANIPAHCRLGLTATLVREDNLISDLSFLVGPELYEAEWMDLTAQGYLANVQCVEVWCPMTGLFRKEYEKKTTNKRRQHRLYIMNPGKLLPVEFLVQFHEARGDKIIVFSDDLFCLNHYANILQRPYVCGDTKQEERQAVYSTFRQANSKVQTICLSKVGDDAIDLPSANVIIQISSQFGARRQEAQRLGRILRPKSPQDGSGSSASSSHDAYFYTLVTPDTQEMMFCERRQQYLKEQGYIFKIVKNLQQVAEDAAVQDGYVYSTTPEDERKLLTEVVGKMKPREN